MDGRKQLPCKAGQHLKPQHNTVLDTDKSLSYVQAQSLRSVPAFTNPVQKEHHEASHPLAPPVLLPLRETVTSILPDRQEPAVQSDCHIPLRILTPAISLERKLVPICYATATQPSKPDPTAGVPISPSSVHTRKGPVNISNRAFAFTAHVLPAFQVAPSSPHSHRSKRARRARKGWHERHYSQLAQSQAAASIIKSDLVSAITTVVLPTGIMVGDSVLENESQAAKLEELGGYKIAIEASWYLQNLLDTPPAKEPLLSALGGLPFWLKAEIEEDLDQWKKYNVTPLFIFDGLSIVGKEEMALRNAKDGARRSEEAWALYNVAKTPEQTKDAVTAFGNSGAIQARNLYRFFQEILYERGLMYETATHSACAYMAYLDKNPRRSDGTQAFEGIMGSLELLLYDIDCAVITKVDASAGIYWAIVKSSLPQKLNVSEETLINSMLMTGTSFLPAFPVLKDREIIKQQPYTITDATNMYRTANKSMITLCETWSEILHKQEPKWEDKYRKAKMAIKHNIHIVDKQPGSTVAEGAHVKVTDFDALTGDHHEYIGLQLPDELYHYMIHGGIGPRLMNWLSWLEMFEFPPLAGGDAEEYRRLVTQQLVPFRAQSIALYTVRIHRAFQHKNFTMRFWFDNTTAVVMNHQNIDPAPDKLASTWRLSQPLFAKQVAATKTKPGSLSFALMSLQDVDFVTLTMKPVAEVWNLKSQGEIMSNTMWRLLHLRGYVDDSHKLTSWGKALTTALDFMGVDCTPQIEEAAFLAFELLRLDQLNVRHRHQEWIGAPQRGTDQDQKHCLLIARCACFIKLRHKEKGYTGPLSKNLLAWHSIIAAVREAERDLVEAIIASMFLFAQADRRNARDDSSNQVRKRVNSDWIKLGFSLPFGKDVDVGLGIAVRTYLDDYAQIGASQEEQKIVKAQYVTQQLPDSVDFTGDLDIAFSFFEAIFTGIKTLGGEIPKEDLAVWTGASKYLTERR